MRGSFGSVYANAWRRAFLSNFRREITPLLPDAASVVIERSATSAQELFDDRREAVPDKQGEWIVGSCSLILAGYRELQAAQIDRIAAYEAVRRAFVATYQAPTRWFTRALLALSRDPVGALSPRFYVGTVRKAYGKSMGFEIRGSADQLDLVVTRCAFSRFFVDHGEPLLTRIVCEWDRNWIDEVNASKRPIRVERPMTISTGCERCEFRHVRVGGDSGRARDIVLERRPEVAASLTEPER